MKWKPLLGIVFAVGGVVGAGVAIMSAMTPPSSSKQAGPTVFSTSGQLKSFGPDKQTVTIAHQAIHGSMGANVMTFEAETPTLFADLQPADRVRFSFIERDGRRVIQTISKQ